MEEDLAGHGGVVKKIVREGKGDFPSRGIAVTVNYVGRLKSTGDVFDESHGYPFKFTIGKGEVIKGWEIAVAKMRPGESAEVTIKSEYGYGKAGSEDIPPDATLVFSIDLIETKERQQATNPDLARLQEIRRQREEEAKKKAEDEAEKERKKKQLEEEEQASAAAAEGGEAGQEKKAGRGRGGGGGKGKGGRGGKGGKPKPARVEKEKKAGRGRGGTK